MSKNQPNLLDSIRPNKKRSSKPERQDSKLSSSILSAPARNLNYRELFQRIQRRNGEIADFDKAKITEAIWKAARSVGGTDRRNADLLADKVILYLSRTYDDHLLTIEEVQDAVEKVLIENGHAKTAKSFILYREERARVRRFRQDSKAGQIDVPFEKEDEDEVEVLTSGEQVVRWNRERITQALIRETGLTLSIADRISRDVEKQIIYSKASRLTASLIRELVNVKLLEYGFSEESQLHGRLGVPLYDVEQMIQGHSPESSSGRIEKALSGSIIRQYALSRVFAQEVAEAHLRGDLHIQNLTEPWQLTESIQSLEYLKKAGLCLPDFSSRWASPESAFELVSQLGKWGSLLESGVTGRSMWDGVNVFLAPILEGQNADYFQAVARALLFEMAGRTSYSSRLGPIQSLGFYFHIPKSLWKTAAMGPGGRYTGKTYAYYEETARQFLEIFLTLQAEGDSDGQTFLAPEFCFHLDSQFFESNQAEKDLQQLETCLPKIGRWCAWFHSSQLNPARIEHFSVPEISGPGEAQLKYPWKMRSSVGPTITINLLALALRAEGNTEELYSLLEQQIHLAFTAFRQHKQFIEALTDRGIESPFPLLDHQGDGEPFFRPGQQRRRLSLWGLGEMARWHTNFSLREEPTCRQFAIEFLKQAEHHVTLTSQSSRIPCETTLESCPEISKRLQHTLSGVHYTEPVLPDSEGEEELQPFEYSTWAAQLEAPHELLLTPSQLYSAYGHSSPALILKQLFQQGREERLVITQPFWICRACSRVTPGSPDICPQCGSLQVALLRKR